MYIIYSLVYLLLFFAVYYKWYISIYRSYYGIDWADRIGATVVINLIFLALSVIYYLVSKTYYVGDRNGEAVMAGPIIERADLNLFLVPILFTASVCAYWDELTKLTTYIKTKFLPPPVQIDTTKLIKEAEEIMSME